MKQVDNTEVGPIIICDGCYDSMNRHSIEIGEGRVIAIDISDKISKSQQCDLCGDNPINPRGLL